MAYHNTPEIILGAGLANQNKQASLQSSTGSGTISLPACNVTFYNVGGTAITVTVNGNAVSVPAATNISFDSGGADNKFIAGMFSWNATGGTVLVAYTF